MTVNFEASAKLPTKFGEFKIYAFRDLKGKEHLALVKGELKGVIPVRVHSKCLTGDTFASLRCDCREQLESALKLIQKKGGILIYLDQEGRGIGLVNKIKAYALQENGLDTVEANVKLGFSEDLREYRVAAGILKHFGVEKVALITNNPEKISGLKLGGIEVVERIPLIVGKTPHNKGYLETKKKKMKHLLD